MRIPFVMGNWKLNGNTSKTNQLVSDLCRALASIKGCRVAVAPPAIYLTTACTALAGSTLLLGAQNVDEHDAGAFTGEISASMLKDVGVRYAIIGHSERRAYHQESDVLIARKFTALKEADIIPVLCIGETEAENEAGETERVCARQLGAILHHCGVQALHNAVVAYEPVWAIGTGKSATPAQAQSIHRFIRTYIAQHDAAIADQLTIQYGGSVNKKNAAELFLQPDIDGALVGGASLQAEEFAAIAIAAERAQNTKN